MGYKDYQQILNLSRPSPAKSTRKSAHKTSDCSSDHQTPAKRRTKTGCFTCRRRKKKCDMDKVDGKCQACIRNFLECCWPEPAEETVSLKKESTEVSEHTGASAYPSPVGSPCSEYQPDTEEIRTLQLPSNKNYKITKITKQVPSPKMKQAPSPEMKQARSPKIMKQSPESKTKFIVTSFNRHKELCQIRLAN